MKKNYLIIKGTIKTNDTFHTIRTTMETLSENLSLKIDRYAIKYLNDKGKENYRSYVYSASKRMRFDSIPIDAIKIAMFQSYPTQRDVIEAQLFITLSPCKEEEWSLTIVWWVNPFRAHDLEEQIQMTLNVLNDILSVRYLCAGRMEDKKAVEPFVTGMLFDERTELENSVARNIGGLRFIDKRLPFLFPYTIVMKHNSQKAKLCFSRLDLIDEPIDVYYQDPEWKACYQNWIELGLIAPLGARLEDTGTRRHGDENGQSRQSDGSFV